MKLFPEKLINGATLFTDGQAAGKIAAIAAGIEAVAGGGNASRDSDGLASLRTELGDEANGNMIVHKNTPFGSDYSTTSCVKQRQTTRRECNANNP